MDSKKDSLTSPKHEYSLRDRAHIKKKTTKEPEKKPKVGGTFRGHPDQRPVKFIFVNSNGNVCLAPSLTWFCNNYHLSKGSISDIHKKRLSFHMGWAAVPMDKIEEVLALIGKTSPDPGKYTIEKTAAIKFMSENQV